MRITILGKAEKQIRKLPELVRIAVTKKIREIAEEQDNLQVKKLKGYSDIYRARVGRYRIVYQLRGSAAEIIAVQHRRDIYREDF